MGSGPSSKLPLTSKFPVWSGWVTPGGGSACLGVSDETGGTVLAGGWAGMDAGWPAGGWAGVDSGGVPSRIANDSNRRLTLA